MSWASVVTRKKPPAFKLPDSPQARPREKIPVKPHVMEVFNEMERRTQVLRTVPPTTTILHRFSTTSKHNPRYPLTTSLKRWCKNLWIEDDSTLCTDQLTSNAQSLERVSKSDRSQSRLSAPMYKDTFPTFHIT